MFVAMELYLVIKLVMVEQMRVGHVMVELVDRTMVARTGFDGGDVGRCVGVSVCRCYGMLVCRCVGVLVIDCFIGGWVMPINNL